MRLLRSLVLSVASLAAATAVAAAPARATATPSVRPAPSVPSASPYATVLVSCFQRPLVMPGDVLLACGDGNDRIGGLTWSSWGRNSAVGTGYEEVNDCDPTCVDGTFHTYPVTVALSGSSPWPGNPHLRRYTELTLGYPADQPDWPHQPTYDLWD